MDPDAFYASLDEPTGDTARALRAALLAGGSLEEGFKHGHPAYTAGRAPVCLVKPAKKHVLFAFWEGRALIDLEPRLASTGGANMASMKLTSPNEVAGVPTTVLVRTAIAYAAGDRP